MIEPLESIINALAEHIDYILNNTPVTHYSGKESVTTFDGREYKNLSSSQILSLGNDVYWGYWHEWKEAVRYHRYLEYHFAPDADYYLREMRESLIH